LKKGAPPGESKTVAQMDHAGEIAGGPESQKFFAAFFQKKQRFLFAFCRAQKKRASCDARFSQF
jgi:hypothetical protein